MRKALTIIIMSALIGISSDASAQGVMGRRFIAGVRFDYFMKYIPSESFFNPGYKGSLSYMASKRVEVMVGVNYYKIKLLDEVYSNGYGGDLLGDASDETRTKELDLTLRCYLQRFRKRQYDCIAPDGKYFEFGIVGSQISYKPGDLPSLINVNPEMVTARIVFGIGNQQVWWDRVAVNTGVLVSAPVYRAGKGDTGNDLSYGDWNTGRNYFRCYLGVGYVF